MTKYQIENSCLLSTVAAPAIHRRVKERNPSKPYAASPSEMTRDAGLVI